MRVNYVYKKESQPNKFAANSSMIELREYMDNLILYSPMNDLYRAEVALYDKCASFEQKPEVFTGGVFGSYLKISDKYSYNLDNFKDLKDELRLSVYIGANKIVNKTSVGLRAKSTFPESGLPSGTYSIGVTVEGNPSTNLSIDVDEGTTVKGLKSLIMFYLDPVVYPFQVNTHNTEEDLIVLQAYAKGRTIKISDGLDGTNLLDYFDIEDANYGSAPEEPIKILEFFNFYLEHFRNIEDGNTKSYLRLTITDPDGINEDQIIEFPWNNDLINCDNLEIDMDRNLIYIFLNGNIVKVDILKNILQNNGTTLSLFGTEDNPYSFEELILNNKVINTKTFNLSRTPLTKYTSEKPYIDYYFSGKEIKNGMEFKSDSCDRINCCLCEDGSYYYYNVGGWRTANGNFNGGINDFYTFADKIKTYNFSNKDFFVRCFFDSNGTEKAYLDTPFFYMEDDTYLDEQGNTSAILMGTKEWVDGQGEPVTESLNGKTLFIETDKGTTTIHFAFPKNNKDSLWRIEDVIEEINSYYPDGIGMCSKDNKDRVILTTETKGSKAYISVSGDAAPYIFGDVSFAKGEDANANSIDYSKFYKNVREYTGEPLIPMEITDQQMNLFLKEALNLYKLWSDEDDTNIYKCVLEGDWDKGFKIPNVIETKKDIVDIIFQPIFPITFYSTDFIPSEGGDNDLFSLIFAQSIARGGVLGSEFSQNYYISLMSIQDFRQTLGINPTWEIHDNRIFIYPSYITRYTHVGIRYRAPLSEEECLANPFIIQYVHGKCLMTMGNIRGQYGSQLATGETNLTFNANDLYARGEKMVENVISYWKGHQGGVFIRG